MDGDRNSYSYMSLQNAHWRDSRNVICGERWKTLPSLLGIFTLDSICLLSVSALAGRKMKKLAFRSIKEISYDQWLIRAGSSEKQILGCIL